MAPEEEFDARLALFTATLAAYMARTLDRNGLLDDETRRLIHLYLPLLAKDAERCADNDETAELLDLLVAVLPPSQR